MSKQVIIIGGGIMGLCSAYYLKKEGCEVTIIDQSNMDGGASYVNAGYISPSHFISLASPQIISKGIKFMFNPSSPLYIKPRWDPEFFKWCLAFKRSASKAKVERSIAVIKDINLLGRALYEELKASQLFDFHYERKGLLMCYKSDKAGEAEWKVGQRGIQEGLGVRHLNREEVLAMEPHAQLDVKGAVYYDCDAHMTPNNFMSEMKFYLESIGVLIYKNERVTDIHVSHGTIHEVLTEKQSFSADEVVMAAGSWSPSIMKKLGLKLPVQAGKGYRIDVHEPTGIQYPAILSEAKVAITPMDGFTRFAGTMELSGINHNIHPKRVEAIAHAVERHYKKVRIGPENKSAAQCGLRPITPDGLPFIGKSTQCKNLTVATGHAMMGWSLGPATGKLVSEIITHQKTTLALEPFSPNRRF